MSADKHYGEQYFAWQNSGGEAQGEANAFKFRPYLKSNDLVLDFGCGSGALLKALGVRGQFGVEINSAAVSSAKAKGIDIRHSLSDFPDACVDAVISNHALEHVENPLEEIREMNRFLPSGGRLIIVVPCDQARVAFDPNDRERTYFLGALEI